LKDSGSSFSGFLLRLCGSVSFCMSVQDGGSLLTGIVFGRGQMIYSCGVLNWQLVVRAILVLFMVILLMMSSKKGAGSYFVSWKAFGRSLNAKTMS